MYIRTNNPILYIQIITFTCTLWIDLLSLNRIILCNKVYPYVKDIKSIYPYVVT